MQWPSLRFAVPLAVRDSTLFSKLANRNGVESIINPQGFQPFKKDTWLSLQAQMFDVHFVKFYI